MVGLKKKKPSMSTLLNFINENEDHSTISKKLVSIVYDTYTIDDIKSIDELNFNLTKLYTEHNYEIFHFLSTKSVNLLKPSSSILPFLFILYNINKYGRNELKNAMIFLYLCNNISGDKILDNLINNKYTIEIIEPYIKSIYNNFDKVLYSKDEYSNIYLHDFIGINVINFLNHFIEKIPIIKDIFIKKINNENNIMSIYTEYSLMDIILFYECSNINIDIDTLCNLYKIFKDEESPLLKEKYKFLFRSLYTSLSKSENMNKIIDLIKDDLFDKNKYGLTLIELIILLLMNELKYYIKAPSNANEGLIIDIRNTALESMKDVYLDTLGITIEEAFNIINNKKDIKIKESSILSKILYKDINSDRYNISIADLITNSSETVEYNTDAVLNTLGRTLYNIYFTKYCKNFDVYIIYETNSAFTNAFISARDSVSSQNYELYKYIIEELFYNTLHTYEINNIKIKDSENMEYYYSENSEKIYDIFIYVKKLSFIIRHVISW